MITTLIAENDQYEPPDEMYDELKTFPMRNNLGAADKTIRIIIALTILVLVFGKIVSVTASLFLFWVSIFLIGTCLNGRCPVYRFLRINTNRNLNDKAGIYKPNQSLLKNYLKNYQEKYSGIEKDFK